MERVLITGGTGTLGHALVKRLYGEYDITIYSRSELRQAMMRRKYPDCHYLLGDIRDFERVKAAVVGHDTVFHLAAMKRIPECEAQAAECYSVNVHGSEVVTAACLQMGVSTCVGVSTDKACQPVTAYGASKLLMEKIFQAMPEGLCKFPLVRLGNVLQSNGSVVKLWRDQLALNKPLTITDVEMTRFWLTPNEAADMVLRAAYNPSAILVPKLMALSISQMARWIAPEAEIEEIGLRSTERMHEYLVSPDELASELEFHFILNGNGELGHIYKSCDVPHLTKGEFMTMLAEVDDE